MEGGNVRDPFAAMRELDNVELWGTFNFENVRLRCGEMMDETTGAKIGVIIEWWFVAIPWFRFRMKLENLHAQAFLQKFQEVMYDETSS